MKMKILSYDSLWHAAFYTVIALLALGFIVPPAINSLSTAVVIAGFICAIASIMLILISGYLVYTVLKG